VSIQVICPNCNFSKEIAQEDIPVGARWVVCPVCRHRFEFAPSEPAFGFEQEQPRTGLEFRVGRGPTPWERREDLGVWQGIYQTFKAALFTPRELFGGMTYERGIREPLAFGLLLGSIGTMVGFFWKFLLTSGGLVAMGFDRFSDFTMSIIFLGIIIISPIIAIITMFVMSGILHLLLLIVRGGKNGFEATFRVVSYSQATQVFSLIPFIGVFIGGVWILIVQIVGLREIHETSYARVILALLIPMALIFFVAMGVLIPFLFSGNR
jgi:hypothetical protein